MKCQYLVPKFECKVYQNGKNRSSNTQSPVCFETVFFVFPEHCVFCLCEVLTRCHRYVFPINEKINILPECDHNSTCIVSLNMSVYTTYDFSIRIDIIWFLFNDSNFL